MAGPHRDRTDRVTFQPRPAPRQPPPDDRSLRPALLAWLDGGGGLRREICGLPDSTVLDVATASLARGTLLRGPDGPVAAEDVAPGTVLATRGGWARVVWTGARAPRADRAHPPLLRVAAGAFGAVPARPVLLGRHALVLLEDPRCVPLAGRRLALAPVAALMRDHAVTPITPPRGVVTHGIAVAGQSALDVAGLPVATAHPAHSPMTALHARAATDLGDTFPMIADGSGFGFASIPCLTSGETRALAETGSVSVARFGRAGGPARA